MAHEGTESANYEREKLRLDERVTSSETHRKTFTQAEEHEPPDGILTLGRSSDVSADRDGRADTKGAYPPRVRIGFVQGCLLIVAFVLAAPGMILFTIAGLFDRSIDSCDRFIHRRSKTEEGRVDKKHWDMQGRVGEQRHSR
jgi:hypothetical protein